MFYLDTGNKDMCCGCGACESICPTKCITMVADEEGFLYPKKQDDLCTDCGLCESVCPSIHKEKIDYKESGNLPKAFMAINKDEAIVHNSASGGVFSAVANAYCKDNFVIFGAQFDDQLRVIHSHVHSLDEIDKYRKSKYVQSDINDSYKKAEEYLKSGKRVLFTGTPCQIAGLRLYLKKEYEHLFCVDLVCHGVPNQKIFDKYIQYLENKYKGKVTDFTFRHKIINKQDKWNSRNVKIRISERELIMNANEDKYLRGFHPGLYYRPSCYKCKYANPKRISDLTMADFWGVEKLFPEKDVHKGISALIVNSVKGNKLLSDLNQIMELNEVDFDYVIQSNAQLNRPAKINPKREQFFDLLNENRFDLAVDRCIPRPSIIRRIASKVLPTSTKDFIKKLVFKEEGE
ncbi:MAG TPA: 4Fe-4S dicluster domain-containing protein [Clostridiales bacterium]|nr:4Fe-4S dicluster domain-containing protein [Clostridiales bacterium]